MGLFGFKKKPGEGSPSYEPDQSGISDAPSDMYELAAKAGRLETEFGVEPSVAQLNELADLHMQMSDFDRAIELFERSMAEEKQLGKASTSLVKLYNKKRAQAARDGDDEAIAHWMEKSQEMLRLSKDVLRGNV